MAETLVGTTGWRCSGGRRADSGAMGRILVTEKIAERGLDRLRAAGPRGRPAARSERRAARRGGPGRPRPHHPLRHHRDRRRAGGGERSGRGRPGRHRARQRRHRCRHRPGRDGRQRAAVQHADHRRAHHGHAPGPGPQHPPGPRRARRRALGAVAVGGRRAGRQGARHRRPRADRQARGPAGVGLRDARDRPRPVRRTGAGPADQRRDAHPRRAGRRGRLPDPPRREDARDARDDRQGAAGQGQARACASSTSRAAA